MQIEINDEITDAITLQSLALSIECMELDINRLEAETELARYQQEDLEYDREMLVHLEVVYDYFGGNL